jgi:hypothetical protein
MLTQQLSKKALEACFVLHEQMLTDCNYAGYDGDKKAFDRLYAEVYVICSEELPDDADIEQVVDTFHEYALEQMMGRRSIGWHLY